MNSIILKEKLKEGLGVAERIASKSPSLPILNSILICTKPNGVEFCSTDLEMGVRYGVLAKNEKEGMVVLPPRAIAQFVALIPSEQITLKTIEAGLSVGGGEFRATIKTLGAEEFPIIPALKGSEEAIEIETPALCRGLAQVVNFTGQTQARPEISGVLFLFQKNTLKLVSTDSFRLAEKTIYFKKESAKETSFILPAKTARELISIFAERREKTKIYISPTQVIFDYSPEGQPQEPHIQLVSRVIDGEYPKYQDVIPSSPKTKAIVDREEFLNHIKAASVFAGKTNDVSLVLDPLKQQIEISARSADVGENNSSLKAQIQGPKVEAAFNWRFLGDGLSQFRGEKIEFSATLEDGPAMLKPTTQDEAYLYVVMPVRT